MSPRDFRLPQEASSGFERSKARRMIACFRVASAGKEEMQRCRKMIKRVLERLSAPISLIDLA